MRHFLCLVLLSVCCSAAQGSFDTDSLLQQAFPASAADAEAFRTASPYISSAAPADPGHGNGNGHGDLSETPEAGVLELVALGTFLLVISQALRANRPRAGH